jgi:hypothetical protein
MSRSLPALLLLWLVASRSLAGEVIANPSVQLDAADVRDVYLGEKQLVGTLRLAPVDNLAAQDEFLANILQTNLRSYQARWTRKTFREGVRAPLIKGSDVEVLNFVRSTPGAVGYVSGRAGAGVSVLIRY